MYRPTNRTNLGTAFRTFEFCARFRGRYHPCCHCRRGECSWRPLCRLAGRTRRRSHSEPLVQHSSVKSQYYVGAFPILVAGFGLGGTYGVALDGGGCDLWVSTRYLGAMGTSAGWALYEIFMILTASVSGIVSGEWRGAGRPSITTLGMGLLLLMVATFLLARSNV